MNAESFMTFNISSQIAHNYSTHSEFQNVCVGVAPLSYFPEAFDFILVEATTPFYSHISSVYVLFNYTS